MRQLMAAMSGKSLDEMERMLLDLMAAVVPKADPIARAAPPSRRRPRRSGVMTYRVRVDLKDTRPPLWRRLELSSDLFLDEVHRVIQRAFGWTDSHLHQMARRAAWDTWTVLRRLGGYSHDRHGLGLGQRRRKE